MGVSHARCCLLTLKDGSVVTSCSLHVLLSACGVCPGLCVLVREGNKNRQNLPVRTYRVRPHGENPGNRLIHSRKKKNFGRPPRELQCSDRAQTSTTGSGRASCIDVVLGFWLKVLVRRDKFENRRKNHNYTYTYTARCCTTYEYVFVFTCLLLCSVLLYCCCCSCFCLLLLFVIVCRMAKFVPVVRCI